MPDTPNKKSKDLFSSSREEVKRFEPHREHAQPLPDCGYQLAFADPDFLLREELRPIRLQLELLRPELMQRDAGIEATIVFFGSARIPPPDKASENLALIQAELASNPDDVTLEKQLRIATAMHDKSIYYEQARALAKMVSENNTLFGDTEVTVSTGGGPGIMEAANRGANDAGKQSLGLGISIPQEQTPNAYVTPELTFPFHYFAIRKMHFLIRAKALIAFPGGFGTLDEMFDALTLLQTQKMQQIPLILFGKRYWESVINFQVLVDEGTVNEEDLNLFHYVETAEQAFSYLKHYYSQ